MTQVSLIGCTPAAVLLPQAWAWATYTPCLPISSPSPLEMPYMVEIILSISTHDCDFLLRHFYPYAIRHFS